MDFERQKPVTEEYRENWERVFDCVCQIEPEECFHGPDPDCKLCGGSGSTHKGPQKDDL